MLSVTDDIHKQIMTLAVDHEGHAQATLLVYPGKFRHNDTHGWLRWNGRFWESEGAAQSLNRAITNAMNYRRAHFALAEKFREAKECSVYYPTIRGAMAQMAKATEVYTPIADFDRSHDHVNCRNGVLDLRDGTLEPHNPSHLYTYCLGIDYIADSPAPEAWQTFLLSCGIDNEMIEYLRLSLGYSLTGYTSEEVMFYLYGKTRSGKGTTMETINQLFGTLSTGVDMETFTSKRYGDTSNFDLAPLKAKRFITASESQRHGQLNPAFIKKATGGDELYCSFKRKDHFSYRPQFKIWLTSNFEANTDVDDDAAWGRLRVIHFPLSFLGKEDKELKIRLKSKESLAAIFRWVVSGAVDWYAIRGQGLPMPDQVRQKTQEHREALDSIAQFIAQCCVLQEGIFSVGSELYAEYKKWCEEEGYTVMGRKRFTQSLDTKGISSVVQKWSGKTQRGYDGIGLAQN